MNILTQKIEDVQLFHHKYELSKKENTNKAVTNI